jgi:hypothetical protein
MKGITTPETPYRMVETIEEDVIHAVNTLDFLKSLLPTETLCVVSGPPAATTPQSSGNYHRHGNATTLLTYESVIERLSS